MRLFIVFFFLSSYAHTFAQMKQGSGEILYGNEWIDFNKDYLKFKVADDGIYRISYETLVKSNVFPESISGARLQMFHNGKEIRLFVSNDGEWKDGDYLEFFGERNLIALDTFLYEDWRKDLTNPMYSLFNDTSAYFLTIADPGVQTLRYKNIVKDHSASGLLPEKYYIHHESIFYDNFFYQPTFNGNDRLKFSHFSPSEGWSSGMTADQEYSLATPHIYQESEEQASVHIRMATNGVLRHSIETTFNGKFIFERSLQKQHTVFDTSFQVDVGELKPASPHNKIRIKNTIQDARFSLAIYSITYPRLFNFDNKSSWSFQLKKGEKYIEFSNFNGGSNEVLVYDIENGMRYIAEKSENIYKIWIDESEDDPRIIIANEVLGVRNLENFTVRKFRKLIDLSPDFLFISGEQLYKYVPTQGDAISDYLNYRKSAAGGSFNPALVLAEEIYDQFGYGIDRHVWSFKNFSAYIKQHLKNIRFILILGKGIEYSLIRKGSQLTDPKNAGFTVPVFGDSPSDYLLFSEGSSHLPFAPVGRIAAKNMSEIYAYLNKVIAHDRAKDSPQEIDKLWTKRIIHLGGGSKPAEQNNVRIFLERMKDQITESKFGAQVVSFFKTSTEPLQPATTNQIYKSISDGALLLTFFGHSAVGTFDFSLEDPAKYLNDGKLPIIISLGCYSGNIYTSVNGLSENFILFPEKGAIGFLAATGVAYLYQQGDIGQMIYEEIGNANYGKTIGEVIHAVKTKLADVKDIARVTLLQQFTLHGDPAIKIFGYEKPDFLTDFSKVKTEPAVINTSDKEYVISYDLVNIGRYNKDSVLLQIINTQINASRTDTIYEMVPTPASTRNYRITLKNTDGTNKGLNKFRINIDPYRNYDEGPLPYARLNNSLVDANGEEGFDYFIFDNAVRPLYPANFSIHTRPNLKLVAGSINSFAPKAKYIFEIDTTALFNSPFKKIGNVEAFGGLVEWNPNIPLENGRVYYWRVSPDATEIGASMVWNYSSFIYILESRKGWNQSHYFQYRENEFDDFVLSEDRKFYFDTLGFYTQLFNGIWDGGVNIGYKFNFDGFAASVKPWLVTKEGIAIGIGDKITGSFRINNGGDYGSINSTNFGTRRVFVYDTKFPDQRKSAIELLESIEDGEFVYFFTVMSNENADFKPNEWENDSQSIGRNLYDLLEANGATEARRMVELGSVPYTFIFRKGFGPIAEDIATDKFQLIATSAFLPLKNTQGTITTPIIGPASKWYELQWSASEVEANDTIKVNVYGLQTPSSQENLLISSLDNNIPMVQINAEEYPYLKLELSAVDKELRSSPQLDYWRVYYEGFPDIAFNPNLGWSVKDSVQQGDDFYIDFQAVNLEEYDMDSVLVKMTLFDQNNSKFERLKRFAPVKAGDNVNFKFTENTRNFIGRYRGEIELNANNDQVEKYFFNNNGFFDFQVFPDITAPVLEVTFDGIAIMDMDIVSPNPTIMVRLKDENQYIKLSRPDNISLTLIYPDGKAKTIDINDPQVDFYQATEKGKNELTLKYRPQLEAGLYKLICVAKDETGNATGRQRYEVNFEVVTEDGITNVVNYPNPFSTSTQFVFTVTGSVPEHVRIRIMTVSGKIVREITEQELGPLRVGRNITSFTWDGRDEFGEKLANGVYLYQVITKNSEGRQYEHRAQNKIDNYFNNGFGKLVIMR